MILSKKIIADYQPMLNDHARNAWFKKHIQNLVPGKTVIDVGAGTGFLSAYALEAGAKHVHAVEICEEASVVGKHILSNIGYSDRLTWSNNDFKQVDIKTANVVIAEQVGPALFDELQLDIWKHCNRILGQDYISIPDELSVDLYIYAGDRTMFVDQYIQDNETLPQGFYSALEKLSIQPSRVIENFVSITKESVDQKSIEKTIMLDSFDQATLVFINKIGYNKDYLYLNRSPSQPWRFPPRLLITDCSRPLRVFWNTALSNKENPHDSLYKGYWDSLPI
jgi:predicted RNA methylase